MYDEIIVVSEALRAVSNEESLDSENTSREIWI